MILHQRVLSETARCPRRLRRQLLLAAIFVQSVAFFPHAGTRAQSAAFDSALVSLYNKDYDRAARLLRPLAGSDTSVVVHRAYQDASLKLQDTIWRDAIISEYRERALASSRTARDFYLFGRCLPCAEGRAYFDSALACDDCYAWALNGRGACYFEAGESRSAKEHFLRAITCDEAFGEAYQNLAQVYVHEGHTHRAQKVFRKLIAQDRSNPRSYEWLGDMYLTRSKHDYARLAYRKAVENGACGPAVFFKLGYACFEVGRYRDAVHNYRRSIDFGNQTYDVRYNLASALELLDYPEQALEQYQLAYVMREEPAVLYSMGNCAVTLGLYSHAIESYEHFLESEPDNPEALFGLANAYQMKKDYDRAVALYRKVLEIDSLFAKAYYNLGSIYAYHLNDPGKAIQHWETYVGKFPKSEDVPLIRNELRKLAGNQ